MKLELSETDTGFWFRLNAETVADAALLARIGMNHIKVAPWVSVLASREGSIEMSMELKSRRNKNYSIKGET